MRGAGGRCTGERGVLEGVGGEIRRGKGGGRKVVEGTRSRKGRMMMMRWKKEVMMMRKWQRRMSVRRGKETEKKKEGAEVRRLST